MESLKELTETLYCLVHPTKSRKNGISGVSVSLLGDGVGFGADFSNDKKVNELKKGRGKTIILDDIERIDFSKIKMKNILGYAERLSLQGFAVVLVMNSKELDNESKKALDEFYEKVVDKKYVISCCDEEVLANQFAGLGVSIIGIKDYFKSNIRMAKKVKKIYSDIKDLAPENERQTLFEFCVKTITGLYDKEAIDKYNAYQKERTKDMLLFEFFDPDTLPDNDLTKKLNAIVYSNDIYPSTDNISIVKGIALYDYDGDGSFLEKYYKKKSNVLYKDSFILSDDKKEALFVDQLKAILDNKKPEPELVLGAIYHMYEEGYGTLANNCHDGLVELLSSEDYGEYVMTSSVVNERIHFEGFGSLIKDVKDRIKEKFNINLQNNIKQHATEKEFDKAYKLLKESMNKRDIDFPQLISFLNDNGYFLDYIGITMPCEDYWSFVCEEASILKRNDSSKEMKEMLDVLSSNEPNNKTLISRVSALQKWCDYS